MKYSQILLGIVICVVLEFAIYNINDKYHFFKPIVTIASSNSVEKREGGVGFTNPLLECLGLGESDSLAQLNVSEPELNTFTDNIQSKYKLTNISVYLRDLNNGPWIGVNQGVDFIGGSLLKVPMLISYLKLADDDPSILKKVILYKEKLVDNNQYFTSSKQLEVGKSYTVDELLQYMISYSDNNAASLLSKNIDPKEFDKVFEALGLGQPDVNKPYPVDTKTYSGFFRILFNASYLSKSSSEKALDLLSHVEFNRGLQGGLPISLIVSHKFGIRTDGDVNQLHDCGIIYYPNHPYLLCVMSRGGTFDDMASSISDISKFVYDKVSATKGN